APVYLARRRPMSPQLAKLFYCVTVSAGFFTLTTFQATATDDLDTVLPRYKLEIGQQLIYEGKSEQKFEGGSFGNAEKWQITVIGRNNDGSHRLVLRYATARSRTDVPGQAKEPEEVYYALANLGPFGEIQECYCSFGFRIDPSPVLP